MKTILGISALLLFTGFLTTAHADVISIGGHITQSSQDGTGPAMNNPSLNNIVDGDTWNLSFTFNGSALSPGVYDSLSIGNLMFFDTATGGAEAGFGTISLTVTQVGEFDEFSLLGCLNSGNSCWTGNQISASFSIAMADLNSKNALASGLDQPHPLDLLEDDGTTDIQGSISSYSYNTSTSPTPEPSTLAYFGEGLLLIGAGFWRSFYSHATLGRKRREV